MSGHERRHTLELTHGRAPVRRTWAQPCSRFIKHHHQTTQPINQLFHGPAPSLGHCVTAAKFPFWAVHSHRFPVHPRRDACDSMRSRTHKGCDGAAEGRGVPRGRMARLA